MTSHRILVVDDEPINQLVAKSILTREGFGVLCAENGERGVSAVVENAVDLVLMDLNMPVMDGFRALASIREWEAASGARLPVIALTAQADEESRRQCLEAGFDAYLTKPVSGSELLETVECLLVYAE